MIEVGAGVSVNRQTESPYRFLAAEILRIAPCDRIVFALPLADGSGFALTGAYPESPFLTEAFIPTEGSCTSRSASERRARLLSSIGEETYFAEEEMLYKAGIRDAGFVPLFHGGELMAVAIVGRRDLNSLEWKSVRCLERVSGLLASVMAAARDASRESDWSDAILAASKFAQAEDSERACRGLLEAIRRVTPYRRAVLTLVDAELEGYQWFFTGLEEEEINTFHEKAPGPEGLKLLFQGLNGTPPILADSRSSFVPLVGSREKPLGYLTLMLDAGERVVPPGPLAAVRTMAAVAAATLERNNLLRELRRERFRRQKTEEQLVFSDRLAALGQTVSGVAHELNNALSGVLGFGELAVKNNSHPQVDRDLQRVVREAKRCQQIVAHLLAFARKTKPERKVIDVNELVESVLDLRATELRLGNVEVELDLAAGLPRTLGVDHQIEQVLLNIINNAHQAMQQVRGTRSLKVSTSAEEGKILIRISDSGPGIAAALIEKVFEPFYTTKAAGEGTGLGLSLSQGLVKEHGGQIRVESLVGKGTAFTVELPILEVPEEELSRKPARPAPPPTPRNILVVDDEEMIVELLNEVLSVAGHRVETARNGRQALDKILHAGYDAVISDLKMPGLDGSGLYDTVCRKKPEMASRFVFSTGDTASPAAQDFFKKTGCPCLSKPFDLQSVRETLDEIFSRS